MFVKKHSKNPYMQTVYGIILTWTVFIPIHVGWLCKILDNIFSLTSKDFPFGGMNFTAYFNFFMYKKFYCSELEIKFTILTNFMDVVQWYSVYSFCCKTVTNIHL